jgi:hypothetical protein
MLNDKEVVAKFVGTDVKPYDTWEECMKAHYAIGILIQEAREKHGVMVMETPKMMELMARCRLTGATFRLKEKENG